MTREDNDVKEHNDGYADIQPVYRDEMPHELI